jgi:hypothetical protein
MPAIWGLKTECAPNDALLEDPDELQILGLPEENIEDLARTK